MLTDQERAEWLATKVGKLGASRFADAVRKLKGGQWAKSRRTLQIELVAERLSGMKQDHYLSVEMLRGLEMEDVAAAAYEMKFDVELDTCLFIENPRVPMSGATPDRRVIGRKKLVEFKCPKTTTFCEAAIDGIPDEDYVAQCYWQIATDDADECDLVYFDDRLPMAMQMLVFPIKRNAKLIEAMESQAREFLAEVAELVEKVSGRG